MALGPSLISRLAYAPVELGFGTSGLRGLVQDMTNLEVHIQTQGFLRFLLQTDQVRPGDRVCVAGDLRPSTDQRVLEPARGEILQAVVGAVVGAGFRVSYLGRIPTPALTYYAMRHGMASVMVTGSHIPFERNGLKFNRPAGEVLKDDEPAILRAVQQVRNEEYHRPAADSPFDGQGMFRPDERPVLPAINDAASREYLERFLSAFPPAALHGHRLLVYEHSAVGRDLLVDLLTQLGAEVVRAGRSAEFIPVDTEAVNDAMLQRIRELVRTNNPGTIEAVVSTDGDSDRPLLLAVDQGMPLFLPGDLVGMVTADFLGARHIAVPISANDAVDRHFQPRGVTVVKTRIGSPYVIAAMREVGWEANGGFLTACALRVPGGGDLSALPTRDAFLPLLSALCAAFGKGRSVRDHFAQLPPRFGRSGIVRDFPGETSRQLVALLTPEESAIEQVDFDGDPPVVRLRNGELRPLDQAEPLAADLARRKTTVEHFWPGQPTGPVRWINYLDGVRIGFASGDVVHFRPSGNAPELRVYANADSPERADSLVDQVIGKGPLLPALKRAAQVHAAALSVRQEPVAILLKGSVQAYDWGGYDLLPGLLGIDNPDRRPFAELWIGAHAAAPSLATLGGLSVTLRELVSSAPEALLGAAAVARFGPELPYLLKVLDVRGMLSIQAHPTRRQAEQGFARDEELGIDRQAPQRRYKDRNHKPEVHVALTEFWMLHGFRPPAEIAAAWESTPELATLMPDLGVRARAARSTASRRAVLQEVYTRIMTLPQSQVDAVLGPLLARLETSAPWPKASHEFWMLRAARTFSGPDVARDRGMLAMGLMNLVKLAPGEGTYQPPGTLHAYLEGATVELMANSDNVLRGGLTRKHVDVEELLATVTFEAQAPRIIAGHPVSSVERVYASPAVEFELSRIDLGAGAVYRRRPSLSADCLVTMDGAVAVQSGRRGITLERGQSLFVPFGIEYSLEAVTPESLLFRASVPVS